LLFSRLIAIINSSSSFSSFVRRISHDSSWPLVSIWALFWFEKKFAKISRIHIWNRIFKTQLNSKVIISSCIT
jgi:hypothetical protein